MYVVLAFECQPGGEGGGVDKEQAGGLFRPGRRIRQKKTGKDKVSVSSTSSEDDPKEDKS